MEIRAAKSEDLPRIMKIVEKAKSIMRESGNITQWNDGYPSSAVISNDVSLGNFYVVTEGGVIHAAFAFIVGEDPTYREIDGKWLSDGEYGTIHRIASDGELRGVFKTVVAYCFAKIGHLRVDTHEDNVIMRKLVAQNGFSECGIIRVGDGTPRIAYEKL